MSTNRFSTYPVIDSVGPTTVEAIKTRCKLMALVQSSTFRPVKEQIPFEIKKRNSSEFHTPQICVDSSSSCYSNLSEFSSCSEANWHKGSSVKPFDEERKPS